MNDIQKEDFAKNKYYYGSKRNDRGGFEIRSNRQRTLFNDHNLVDTIKSPHADLHGELTYLEGQLIWTVTKRIPYEIRQAYTTV